MKVWNTTGFKVEAGAMGTSYVFEAFEEKEVWNTEHAVHLEKSFADSGIVMLNYDKSAESKYTTYDEYKSSKEVWALKKVLSRYETALNDSKQYLKDVKQSGGTEADKETAGVDKFEEKVKLIKSWLKEAGEAVTDNKPTSVPKRPNWRKVNDTNTATNKG